MKLSLKVEKLLLIPGSVLTGQESAEKIVHINVFYSNLKKFGIIIVL